MAWPGYFISRLELLRSLMAWPINKSNLLGLFTIPLTVIFCHSIDALSLEAHKILKIIVRSRIIGKPVLTQDRLIHYRIELCYLKNGNPSAACFASSNAPTFAIVLNIQSALRKRIIKRFIGCTVYRLHHAAHSFHLQRCSKPLPPSDHGTTRRLPFLL